MLHPTNPTHLPKSIKQTNRGRCLAFFSVVSISNTSLYGRPYMVSVMTQVKESVYMHPRNSVIQYGQDSFHHLVYNYSVCVQMSAIVCDYIDLQNTHTMSGAYLGQEFGVQIP